MLNDTCMEQECIFVSQVCPTIFYTLFWPIMFLTPQIRQAIYQCRPWFFGNSSLHATHSWLPSWIQLFVPPTKLGLPAQPLHPHWESSLTHVYIFMKCVREPSHIYLKYIDLWELSHIYGLCTGTFLYVLLAYIYTHTHIYIHIYMYICVCVCVCVCVCQLKNIDFKVNGFVSSEKKASASCRCPQK